MLKIAPCVNYVHAQNYAIVTGLYKIDAFMAVVIAWNETTV